MTTDIFEPHREPERSVAGGALNPRACPVGRLGELGNILMSIFRKSGV